MAQENRFVRPDNAEAAVALSSNRRSAPHDSPTAPHAPTAPHTSAACLWCRELLWRRRQAARSVGREGHLAGVDGAVVSSDDHVLVPLVRSVALGIAPGQGPGHIVAHRTKRLILHQIQKPGPNWGTALVTTSAKKNEQ